MMNCEHEWQLYDRKNSITLYRVCAKCKCAQKRTFGNPLRTYWYDVSTTAIVALALKDKLTPIASDTSETFERIYP